MSRPKDTVCPCGSRLAYAGCCGRWHAGGIAPTAEALMRSRYSAYVLSLETYLLTTWHANTRPLRLDLAADRQTRWLGLEVRKHAPSGENSASVEFVARYKIGGHAHRLHETSRFLREDGYWYYLDGEFPDAPLKDGKA